MGMRLEVVQSLVGHNDLRTTLQYVDLDEQTKRSEMEKWKGA
jgi:site-specific recombinase XerD